MLTAAQAAKAILDNLPLLPAVAMSIGAARGSVLREALCADRPGPPFDRAMLDGIACRCAEIVWAETAIDSEAPALELVGVCTPGTVQGALPDRACAVRIMTGAAVPAGADVVIGIEDVEFLPGTPERVRLRAGAPVRPGGAIHPLGSDFHTGDLLVSPGTILTPRHLATAASIGATNPVVSRKPRVLMLQTGDELVSAASAPLPHQLRRSNNIAVGQTLEARTGAHVDVLPVPDDLDALRSAIAMAGSRYDAIVTTGAISLGMHDHLPAVLRDLGADLVFRGVAQRPGKPMAYFLMPVPNGSKLPFFALPGNPVSALTCAVRYVVPALLVMQGAPPEPPRWVKLDSPLMPLPSMEWLLPAALAVRPNADWVAAVQPYNTSGDFAALDEADGFVEVPPGDAPLAGPLRWWAY